MNYILEQKIGWRDVVDHNSTIPEISKLFDDRYNTICRLPKDQSYLYFKVPYDDMQFVVFHNISASKVKVKVLDNTGTLLEEKEKETERLISRPIINGGETIKSFYDISFYVEMAPVQNPGFLEIYIYPLNGAGYIGRVDYGIPEFLGCLNWDFSQSMRAVQIPKENRGDYDNGETTLLSMSNTYSVRYSVFKNASMEDDPEAHYLKNRLESLFNTKYKKLTIADTTGNVHDLTNWVMKKVTFIDPFATKQTGLFSIDSFDINGKNAIVSEVRVTLRGWQDNRDKIEIKDDDIQYVLPKCVATEDDECWDVSTFYKHVPINNLDRKDYPAKAIIRLQSPGTDATHSSIYFDFMAFITGKAKFRLKQLTKEPVADYYDGEHYAISSVHRLTAARAGSKKSIVDIDPPGTSDEYNDIEFDFEIFDGNKYSIYLDFAPNQLKYEITIETEVIDFGNNDNYVLLDCLDKVIWGTDAIVGSENFSFDDGNETESAWALADADGAWIKTHPYRTFGDIKQTKCFLWFEGLSYFTIRGTKDEIYFRVLPTGDFFVGDDTFKFVDADSYILHETDSVDIVDILDDGSGKSLVKFDDDLTDEAGFFAVSLGAGLTEEYVSGKYGSAIKSIDSGTDCYIQIATGNYLRNQCTVSFYIYINYQDTNIVIFGGIDVELSWDKINIGGNSYGLPQNIQTDTWTFVAMRNTGTEIIITIEDQTLSFSYDDIDIDRTTKFLKNRQGAIDQFRFLDEVATDIEIEMIRQEHTKKYTYDISSFGFAEKPEHGIYKSQLPTISEETTGQTFDNIALFEHENGLKLETNVIDTDVEAVQPKITAQSGTKLTKLRTMLWGEK